jgi:hypothetical protein
MLMAELWLLFPEIAR